jgi:hypothetical protein
MNLKHKIDAQKLQRWFKRIGLIGFLFFLVKGLAWLVLGYLLLK